jgi:hypothetical protein
MRGPTTLMNDMRSGDDHSKERSPLRTTPNEFVVSVVKIGRFGNYLSAKKGVLGAKLKSFRYSTTQKIFGTIKLRYGKARYGTGSNSLNWIEL